MIAGEAERRRLRRPRISENNARSSEHCQGGSLGQPLASAAQSGLYGSHWSEARYHRHKVACASISSRHSARIWRRCGAIRALPAGRLGRLWGPCLIARVVDSPPAHRMAGHHDPGRSKPPPVRVGSLRALLAGAHKAQATDRNAPRDALQDRAAHWRPEASGNCGTS